MSAYRIRTTVVGSYPVPDWLFRASSPAEARRDALLVILKTQELCGIDVLSDGELFRYDPSHPETNGMVEYFVHRMSGISARLTREEREAFQRRPGMRFRRRSAGVVREPIGEGILDLAADWSDVREMTPLPVKLTVTSPFMLAQSLLDHYYRNVEKLTMAMASVLRSQVERLDAELVQIDEANLPGRPEHGDLAARAINEVLGSVRGMKGVHVCFGNYGGQPVQKGQWKRLLKFLNKLACDHLILEFARRGYEELEVFRDLKPEISLGIGVIDVKDNEIESPELVAERIEYAVELLGSERIQWVHPDCGLWMLPRPVADAKMRTLVLGRDLFQSAGR